MIAEIKELIHNFINPIIDNNARDIEIPDDNFMNLAMASGMSIEDINLLQKTRNGTELTTKKIKRLEEVKNDKTQIQVLKENREKKNDKGREPGE